MTKSVAVGVSIELNKEGAEQFGAWLKARREKVGLSQSELTRTKAIVGRTTLNQVESGKATIRTENALALGRAVGASDLETIVATGMIGGIEPGDVQLLEQISRLNEKEQRLLAGMIALMLREREKETNAG